MSEFSACLGHFIKEGKTDTALLAERTGVPRSVIASFLKGKNLPEQAVFRLLLRELPLTVEKERILSHCYYVSSVGEWAYRRRSYMQQQLSTLAEMIPQDAARPDCNPIEPIDFHTLPKEGIQLYRGPFAVEGVLHQILSEEIGTQEHPMVCTNAILRQGMLQRILLWMYLSAGGKLELRHVLPLTKDTRTDLNNLKALFGVLPFCIAPGCAYHPWFYYSTAPLYADVSTPFSFYLYTNQRLLWLSDNLETAALVSSDDLLAAYKERFDQAVKLSRPLIHRAPSAKQMIDASANFYASAEPYQTYSLELQPCLGPFLTKEMIERIVNLEEEGTEELAYALYEYYQTMAPRMTKITSICWERGLDLFIDEGRLCTFPPAYARAFDKQDRLELLKRFHQGVMDGKILLYFVNESRFPFVEGFSLHCQGERKAAFEVHDSATQLYASIIFDEQSLCGAFYDFIQSMPEGEWVYSREESLAILERGIARCEQLALLDS